MNKNELSKTYFTALGSYDLGLKGIDRYESKGNVVFAYDINQGIAAEFENADVVYSEPCWRNGYEIFAKRANVVQKVPYNEYLKRQSVIIETLGKPAFILAGKQMLRYLNADDVVPIVLKQHNGLAFINLFNADRAMLKGCETNEDVIECISQEFSIILDFNCGYGNIVPHVIRNKKHFVCSDLCPTAVEYIARTYMGLTD